MISLTQMLVMLGMVLILAELIVGIQTGFDLVLIGSILIIGGFGGIWLDSLTVALVMSAFLSFLYIFWGRKIVKQKVVVMSHNTNIDKLHGKTGVIIRTVTSDTAGMVRLDDEDWRAVSDELIYEKEKVKIKSIEGVSLIVEKIKK
ncbi:hypothetical protein A2574_00040 [Candidatus Shapirobacteria bacterium RIFOXYD1_FULL_38_32]|uniref:Nodulation efficiency, NfeD n=2 Tax=Candidatus Shapironibacteriota TaxID=1752721 RepID=A0A0G0M683_9BACT|nr:MAG: Nodulation efficiency, NfeD [Candidatus Shapirobacteria bacterium GW2011_GWE2_38_30]OGL55619.1 MAG: hypothetical protein A2195_01080 [Candidatus Shapirobacteria bacterium RIFOXYA1_FULL_39_17]OGL56540.1 MAG: hypothetical protein A2410_01605 [Candidatus Shapirobacteria bacterium RIFOXYC1_FULL_38_24]OGL57918.1 MAG: hypothetical protein A2367_01790 [Candidatus Shapirobacteria bacterium RIFOXYB1_FULL_38_38]OGL58206.1 MAG: hypothetical protein A2574_00040 [Candidatus Shapirobacteria bacterium